MFYFTSLMILVLGVAAAFPPSVEVFLVYRFLQGSAGTAIYMSAFVLGQLAHV